MPQSLTQLRSGRAAEGSRAQHEGRMLALYGVAVAVTLVVIPDLAFAYVGPGLGLGAIGSAFSLIGAVFFGIVGFIWYPIDRLLKVFRRTKAGDASDE